MYPERDEPRDDDARRVAQVRRHAREHLAADDAVNNNIALHAEHVEHARDDRAVVPALRQYHQKI